MTKKSQTRDSHNYLQSKIRKKLNSLSIIRKHKQAMLNQNDTPTNRPNNEPNNFDKYGTWSDRTGIIINIVVAIVTLALFFQTKKATQAATESSIAAQNTFTEQRYNDSVMRYRDSIKAIGDKIEMENNFKLDSTSLQAQINSILIAQEEFNIENQSYLQLIHFKLDTFKAFKPLVVSFSIINLGKSPAKIFETKQAIIIRSNPPSIQEIERNAKPNDIITLNTYIGGHDSINFPNIYPLRDKVVIPEMVDGVYSGKEYIYCVGIIKYLNMATKQNRIYSYVIQFIFRPIGESLYIGHPRFIENDDIPYTHP